MTFLFWMPISHDPHPLASEFALRRQPVLFVTDNAWRMNAEHQYVSTRRLFQFTRTKGGVRVGDYILCRVGGNPLAAIRTSERPHYRATG